MIDRLIAPLVAAGLLLSGGGVAAQTTPPALPEADKPIRMSGVGLAVADLERSRRFYTEVLGFKVDAKVPAQGEVQEYLLGLTGDLRADTLVVIRKGQPQPGATTFGRVVLVVPSGRRMAERVKAAGGDVPRIVDGTNLVRDPDGYMVELYQRPAAPAR